MSTTVVLMPAPLTVVDPHDAVMSVGRVEAPLWTPWPLPDGWSCAGFAFTESVRRPATVTSWSALDPFGDPTEVLFICEEAGGGVGAHFAGLPLDYPTAEVGVGAPHAQFEVAGHLVSLWAVDGAADLPGSGDLGAAPRRRDRSVYAGEAAGRWLWVVVHPAEAGVIVIQPLTVVDAHTLGAELTLLPLAELSPRLVLAAAGGP